MYCILQKIMPNATWSHCFLDREALESKDLPPVIKTSIKVVNSIKGRALQTRIFRKICEGMGALFENLYTQVSNLQGRDINIITATDKIKEFLKKSIYGRLGKKQLNPFQCFQEIMEDVFSYNATNFEQVFAGTQVTLLNLKQQLCDYFREEIQNSFDSCRWVLNTFLSDSFQHVEIPINRIEKLIEISSDGMLKLQFFSQNPDEFWSKRIQEYPQVANHIYAS
ncbi:unnamed protein product [Psylliodes chrysocephalus]|uniref:Uncharacterized protein n=1 Tax=Psylliodes chrysocephalus TaxID=3402493 RepID=A0A9P0CNK3_9CUCU|nr:unnamed protein product [Psylliodes chrysocephala]